VWQKEVTSCFQINEKAHKECKSKEESSEQQQLFVSLAPTNRNMGMIETETTNTHISASVTLTHNNAAGCRNEWPKV